MAMKSWKLARMGKSLWRRKAPWVPCIWQISRRIASYFFSGRRHIIHIAGNAHFESTLCDESSSNTSNCKRRLLNRSCLGISWAWGPPGFQQHISSHICHVGLFGNDSSGLYDFQRVIKVETSLTLLDKPMPPGAVFDALDVSGSTRKAGQFAMGCQYWVMRILCCNLAFTRICLNAKSIRKLKILNPTFLTVL